MKIYLDDKKSLDLDLHNWNTKNADAELEILRKLICEFIAVIGDMPIYDPVTGIINMHAIIENEYVFNLAIRLFGIHFRLKTEIPNYDLKEEKVSKEDVKKQKKAKIKKSTNTATKASANKK